MIYVLTNFFNSFFLSFCLLAVTVFAQTVSLIKRWAPLNGITDKGIYQLMWSKLSRWQVLIFFFSYLLYVVAHSLIFISRLLESVCLCPKVIPLSGFHSIRMSVSGYSIHICFLFQKENKKRKQISKPKTKLLLRLCTYVFGNWTTWNIEKPKKIKK